MFFIFLLLTLFQLNESGVLYQKSSALFNSESFVNQEKNIIDVQNLTAEVVYIKEFHGKTLYNKNGFLEKPIASLTKLMSSYISYLIYKTDDYFVFDKESVSQEGETGNFYVGEKISRDDALKASLVASSNDAIFLLAKNYGLENFIKLMNKKSKEFQMLKTNFVDPTGLSPENVSTAYDLYLLSLKIYSQTPEIFEWTRLEKININGKILWTTNLLLPKYKNIIVGAKTGFIKESGENLLMILKFNKSPFLSVIILNSKDRFADAEKIIQALKEYYGD